MTTLSSREVAQAVLGDQCKPTSYKQFEMLLRRGEIKGRKVLGKWRSLEEDVRDYLSHRNGRR